jgi:DNA helicase-2/ATP-dependent DNA helicase PcrA
MLPAARAAAARPRAGAHRRAGAVTVGLYDTVAEETEALADRLAACWNGTPPPPRRPAGRRAAADDRRPGPARKQLPGIAAALRERGLPVEVVGLGGLLEVPEVSDVVATLTVLVDPTAGDALGRLLTGARWRIGPRDLAALEARARALVHARRPAPPARAAEAPSEAARERGSIVEALDDLGDPRPTRRRATAGCAGWPASWRTCAPGWASRCPTWSTRWPARWAWRPSWPAPRRQPGRRPRPPRRAARRRRGVHRAGRAALAAGVPRLPARRRGARAGLEPGEVAVNPEAVQLLTGHSAKGLEWDVVAVPG